MGAAFAARTVVAGARDDLGLHLVRLGPAVQGGPQLAVGALAAGHGHQGAQHYAAAGDDLLDVHDVHGVRGEGLEQAAW